ncbi:MAG: hypothetical protein EA377_03350 [Phycisphaerales bacterium]|nr:MAG: hypothetical protein EA377_03350 [Phycisphaerales bacterium]
MTAHEHDTIKTVERDRPCAKCGYSLRTMPRKGTCPECGYSVIRSLHLPVTRRLLEREDRVLARRDAAARWRSRVTVLAIVLLTMAGIALAAIALPILPGFAESERAARITAIIIVTMLAGGLLPGTLLLLLRQWLNVQVQHADYIDICRRSGDGARAEDERKRDGRILRRIGDYQTYTLILSLILVVLISMVGLFIATLVWGVGDGVQAIRTNPLMIASALFWILLPSLLLWIARARHLHAQSIQYSRAAEQVKQRMDSSGPDAG